MTVGLKSSDHCWTCTKCRGSVAPGRSQVAPRTPWCHTDLNWDMCTNNLLQTSYYIIGLEQGVLHLACREETKLPTLTIMADMLIR